jgi:hypothetical protein
MPGFLDQLGGLLQGGAETFREDIYPSVRNRLARTALDLGGAQTGQEGKQLLHEGGNFAITKRLGDAGVPPDLAANISDLGYLGNETFTGGLAKLMGRPFFSDYGFRWGDVSMNRQGQDRAVSQLLAEKALETARQAEIEQAGGGRLPFSGKQ